MNIFRKAKIGKIALSAVGLTMAVMMVFGVATTAQAALTQVQIDAIIGMLKGFGVDQTTIDNVQTSLTGGTPTVTTPSVSSSEQCDFTRSLTIGSRDNADKDVTCLQNYLKSEGHFTATATGYFGPITKTAVAAWQEDNGITPAAGYFGLLSRTKYNELVAEEVVSSSSSSSVSSVGSSSSAGSSSSVAATTTGLIISSAAQPANSLAPQSASRVPFTKFIVTAGASDVTITGVNVERTGFANDAVFAGIVLLDEDGTQFDIAKTLGSNHTAVIGGTLTIKAGTTKTLTVAGNMGASLGIYAGQVASLNVTGVSTAATVSGSFPITGAMHTINSTLTLGTVVGSVSSYDPGTTATKAIGTTGYKFTGVRITAGSAEDVRLKSVRFYQAGSAGSGDLSNVMVYVDGAAYSTTVSVDGKYYSANLGSGLVIAKGLAKDIWIAGDITGSGSAGRTIDFDIQKNTDIYVAGETYGYGIIASGTITTATPSLNASAVTVSAGSFTSVTKATLVAADNIAINLASQKLGGYITDITGEAISVQSHVFTIASTTPSGVSTANSVLTSISLYDENGTVVAGPVDAVAVAGGSTQTVTFTDTVTYPIGKRTYTLKGKVPASIGNGSTYIVTATTMSSITGQTTGNTISSPTLGFAMNTMTVKSAALAVSQSTNPAAQFIVAGSQEVVFANFQLDASQSGEDVRLSSITLKDTIVSPAAATDTTSCQLWDGEKPLNTGSNVVNPTVALVLATPFTFDTALTITKNTVKTLTLKCNVASGITGSFTWNMTAAQISGLTVTGVISGTSITATGGVTTGATQTVGVGSLAVSTAPSSPSYAIAAAGSSGNIANMIRFRATNEAVNLSRIGLTLTNTASSSASDIVQVSIYDGGQKVGAAVFTGSNRNATSTLDANNNPADGNQPVNLPKDTDKDLAVKVEFAQIGTGFTGVQGDLIAIDSNATADSTGTQGTGAGSGTTINATGSTAVSGIRLFKSFPTFALDTLSANGVTDGKLMRFKVTTNANGGVGINQFKFTMATTSATVTAVNLFGFTDSSYASGISGFTSGQLATSNVAPAVSGAVTITPSAIVNIPAGPAGVTYYFELRGTVTGTGTAYSVNTTLLGDSAHPSLAANMGTSATVAALGNLTWSPNATTTSAATHVDWTLGYGVSGLPSSGLSNNRAQ